MHSRDLSPGCRRSACPRVPPRPLPPATTEWHRQSPYSDSAPQPSAGSAFAPICFIQMHDGLCLHLGLHFSDRRGQRLGGRLHARAERPWRYPSVQGYSGDGITDRPCQPMPLIFGHNGLDGRQFGHLIPVWLQSRPRERLPAAGALRGNGRHDHGALFDGHKRLRLSFMARLSTRLPPTELTTRPPGLGMRRIARWGR